MTPHDGIMIGSALLTAFSSTGIIVTATAAAVLGTMAVLNLLAAADAPGSET